jgi:hypothetical protein
MSFHNLPPGFNNQWPDHVLIPKLNEIKSILTSILSILGGAFGGGTILKRQAATGIAASTQTEILTYTNSTGDSVSLDKIISEANIDALYIVEINAAEKFRYRTTGSKITLDTMFPSGIDLANGDIVTVDVIHYESGFSADFVTTLFGHTT